MTVTTLFSIFTGIGSVVGILITLITFWTLISKKPIAAFKRMIREESVAANQPLKGELDKIKSELISMNNRLNIAEKNDQAIIRNTLTHLYFKYKDNKKIPHYEKENVMQLYERYKKLHGNSYVSSIVKQIEGWDEIIEK